MSGTSNDTNNCDLLTCDSATTSVTGDNIITSCYINPIIGMLCLLGYVVWRTSPIFGVYSARLHVPGVRRRPPPLRTDGLHRIFSWMTPLWSVSDKEFLASAGFDAFVATRVIALGIGIFLPLTVLGVGVLLPVNYTAGYLDAQDYEGGDSNTTLVFQKMTLSNVPDGSPLLWIHWSFMVIFVGWTCYLLLAFYEEHIAMCHTIASGRIGPGYAKDRPADGGGGGAGGSEGGEDASPAEETPSLENMERVTSMTRRSSVRSSADFSAAAIAAAGAPAAQEPNDFGLPGLTTQEENEGNSGADRGPGCYELWPIRRGDPPELAASRPPHAGQYTVLVIDEPPRRFRIKDTAKVFGMQLRLTRVDSLQASQDGSDFQSNWYWLGGAMGSRRSSSRRNTMLGGAEERRGSLEPLEEEGEEAAADGNGGGNGAAGQGLVSRAAGRVKGLAGSAAQHAAAALPWEGAAARKGSAALEVGSRMRVVAATFKRLFGDDFDCIVPVYDTQAMDAALTTLYWCQARVARAELAAETAAAAAAARPDSTRASRRLTRAQASLKALRAKEAALQDAAAAVADVTLNSPPRQSFIAVFRTAKAAAMAADLNVNPVHWRGLHLRRGVDPENVNFVALQRGWWARQVRAAVALVAIVLIMLFPLGIFTGAFSQLDAALCGGDQDATGSLTGTWFCSDDMWAKLLRNILTGMIPSILMSVYQSVVLPIYLYCCALAESRHVSLTEMDARCARLFFHWNWCNFFLGTMLGGAIFNGLRDAIQDPSSIIDLLGTAVPAASNFFINYVLYRALAMTFFRLFWPHSCIFPNILVWLRLLPKPKTPQDVAFANPLRNCRFSRDVFVSVFAVFVASIGYAVIAPFIVPVAFIYFVLMMFVWRQQQLYVFQSAYNSRGQVWCLAAHRIVACLAIMVLFTSAMFFVKGAFVQGSLGLVVVEVFLIAFDKYLAQRYDSVFASMPVAVLEAAPRVDLDPELYVQPPLRQGAEGWYLEYGKCWQGWGVPRYGL